MPPHHAANGSVPGSSCDGGCASPERRARPTTRALAALAALALATGCATAVPPEPPRRAAEEAAARAAAAREASGFVGVYEARLAANGAPARAVTLLLRSDGTAELASVQLGRGVDRHLGRWGISGEELRVEWDTPAAHGAVPTPSTWLRSGDRLAPVQWDPAAWGDAGLPLARWEASRPPHPGCSWSPFADAFLGLRLLVESCGPAGPVFEARGTEIVQLAPSAAPGAGANGAPGTAIVQVFAKKPRQPLADAIRKRFFPQLVPNMRKGCVVRRGGGVDLGDPAKETWTIVPTEKYQAQTARWRAAEPAAMVCGPYGQRDGIGYFEFHPRASPGRYLFVWIGRDAPRFDERSIQLLD